jgi:hypothetical protein
VSGLSPLRNAEKQKDFRHNHGANPESHDALSTQAEGTQQNDVTSSSQYSTDGDKV